MLCNFGITLYIEENILKNDANRTMCMDAQVSR